MISPALFLSQGWNYLALRSTYTARWRTLFPGAPKKRCVPLRSHAASCGPKIARWPRHKRGLFRADCWNASGSRRGPITITNVILTLRPAPYMVAYRRGRPARRASSTTESLLPPGHRRTCCKLLLDQLGPASSLRRLSRCRFRQRGLTWLRGCMAAGEKHGPRGITRRNAITQGRSGWRPSA